MAYLCYAKRTTARTPGVLTILIMSLLISPFCGDHTPCLLLQDGYEFLHSNGTKEEAMIIEFKLTNQKQGEYSMVNLGKPGDMRSPATNPPSYISYHTVGQSHWVCSIDPKYPPWKATDAMTVELWKPVSTFPSAVAEIRIVVPLSTDRFSR